MAIRYLCLLLPVIVMSAQILVDTENGKVRGKTLTSPSNKTFYAFQGIPYAVPPIGDLRFQATTASGKWDGIFDATKEGKSCIGADYNHNPEDQSENCLFLNIYTPSLDQSAKYPVLFWIHGGRFVAGTSKYSRYGADYLVDQGVIFVSLNYRLGPLGFLSTEDLAIPGNAGLKDQLLGLEWVNRNIEAFGGDSQKITIGGQSAGGSSCGLLVLSKKAKGLFRAAICQSGSGLEEWAIYKSPRKYAYKMANLIDSSVTAQSHNSEQLLEFLKRRSASSIIHATGTLGATEPKEDFALSPNIEVDHEGALLSEFPYELMRRGDFNQVPLLMGITSEEFLLFAGQPGRLESDAERLDTIPDYCYPYHFVPKDGANETEIVKYIKDMYLAKGRKFSDNLYDVVRFRSDQTFNRGVIKHAEMQSKFTDVYFYQFSFKGSLNRHSFDMLGGESKCAHGDDLAYLFIRDSNPEKGDGADELTTKRMVRMWTNFVKYLNPTPDQSDELLQNLHWPKVKPDRFPYVNIGSNLEVLENPKSEMYSKWNHVFHTWHRQPFKTF
ncbi:juvenile hormone esterase-like [Cylas formicarius]|uniref:juvenile hormone esterase-like n=1 Tax=Cylas formicarius TaxID=197179 RepID=UPI0029583446|nr:juvenile hormone esterase-like [Cylas formicarius]